MPLKQCKHCNASYKVRPCKVDTSVYCSKKCKWDANGWSSEPNTTCTNCGVKFHLKESSKNRFKRTLGFFCSNVCVASFKSVAYTGSKNPNYKAVEKDTDGYPMRVYTDACSGVTGLKSIKLHQAVCCEVLGIEKIPKGLHVHHRDCDVMNNSPENLVVLNASDHKWLHKQYGIASLWAHFHGKIDSESLCDWSDDRQRARRLLDLKVTDQKAEELTGTERGDGGFGSTGN